MKKFFNFYAVVMLLMFIVGLVVEAVFQNWPAFIWIITGAICFLLARFHETSKQDLIEKYEGKIAKLRAERDDYMRQYNTYLNKYKFKVKENYDLNDENLRLTKEIQRLGGTASELGGKAPIQESAVGQEPVVHGNIKIKRKRKPSPEVDTNVQDKTE